MLPNNKKTTNILINITVTRTLNVISLIQYVISLFTAAIQHDESTGFCKDAEDNYLVERTPELVGGTSKETCLSECLRVVGAKGCDWEPTIGCYAAMVEVADTDGNYAATCWKFFDTGESQYGQKQI